MDTDIPLGVGAQIYTYTPLRGKDTIRIAYLSRVGDQLHARLQQVELSQWPAYCALSYVWRWSPESDRGLADSSHTKPIYLDGCEIQVTPNLADFIDAITITQPKGTSTSPQPPPLPYWIDAICINQADDGEKSVQVRMMGKIYDKATCITIWLGRHDHDSRRCISKMKICATAWQDYEKNIKDNGATTSDDDERSLVARNETRFADWLQGNPWFMGKDGGVVDLGGWRQLGRFFQDRQWWDRMWTTQEYLPQVERIFMCGDLTFYPEIVAHSTILQMALESSESWGQVGTEFDSQRSVDDFRDTFHEDLSGESPPTGVFQVLKECRHRAATDPRDKVFAVLGLLRTDEWNDPLLSVNYALPVATVFTNIARYILRESTSLDWLCEAGSSSTLDFESRQCPSWVPDWSDTRVDIDLVKETKADDGSMCPLYSPWGKQGHGTKEDGMAWITESSPQAELHLCGACLDEIQVRYETVISTHDYKIYLGWIKQLENELGVEYSGTHEPMWRAALRTMRVDTEVDDWGNVTRPPAGLDQLTELPMADRVQQFLFGTAESSIMAKAYRSLGREVTISRCLAVTRKGYICLAPGSARAGDHVYTFAGGNVMYIVRREAQVPERYAFVGETYVHGLMDGEWRDKEGMGAREPTSITLV